MPRTLGNSFIAADAIHVMVEHESPLPEVAHPAPDDVSRASVAGSPPSWRRRHLQVGIGSIPDAILEGLADKHDLGLHTEMLSDGNLPLIESGVINNARKTLHRGKIIATFVMGTQRSTTSWTTTRWSSFTPTSTSTTPLSSPGTSGWWPSTPPSRSI